MQVDVVLSEPGVEGWQDAVDGKREQDEGEHLIGGVEPGRQHDRVRDEDVCSKDWVVLLVEVKVVVCGGDVEHAQPHGQGPDRV